MQTQDARITSVRLRLLLLLRLRLFLRLSLSQVRVRVRVRVVESLSRKIFADIALAVALGTMGISKIQSGSTTGMNAISSFSI
jgi:hypothetical protein